MPSAGSFAGLVCSGRRPPRYLPPPCHAAVPLHGRCVLGACASVPGWVDGRPASEACFQKRRPSHHGCRRRKRVCYVVMQRRRPERHSVSHSPNYILMPRRGCSCLLGSGVSPWDLALQREECPRAQGHHLRCARGRRPCCVDPLCLYH